jgi:hypothetical protein
MGARSGMVSPPPTTKGKSRFYRLLLFVRAAVLPGDQWSF